VREPYWRKDADGRSWLGRGLVQLTHKDNYVRLGREIGVDLVAEPARAMQIDVAVRILFAGMLKGLFTGHKLGDYFQGDHSDWSNARKIINGRESMDLVASHAKVFYRALVRE
jgi:predicted chitinase